MRAMKLNKKATAIVAAGLLVGSAGAAYAFWTQSGTGVGSAQTGTNASVTVNQTGSTVADLYPGGPATILSGNFDNPNASKVYVASVSVSIPAFSSRTDGTKPACTEADFLIDVADVPVNAEVVPGNAQGAWTGLSVSLKNTAANQDNCKTVVLPLSYSSN